MNTVRELLGHKDLTMTLRYAHLSPNHKTRAINVLDRIMSQNPPQIGKGLKGGFSKALKSLAGGKGVEPLFTESESVVLPLNDPPIFSKNVTVLRLGFSEWKYILTQKSHL